MGDSFAVLAIVEVGLRVITSNDGIIGTPPKCGCTATRSISICAGMLFIWATLAVVCIRIFAAVASVLELTTISSFRLFAASMVAGDIDDDDDDSVLRRAILCNNVASGVTSGTS